MNMCLILNGYRDRAVSISRLNSIRFLLVGLDKERSYKERWIYETNCSLAIRMPLPA